MADDSNKFSALVGYFQKLAKEHKLINGFYRFELEEVLTSLKNIKTPALILEGYGLGFTDNRSDNVLKNRNGYFILIDQVKDRGDFDEIHNVWDNMEEIGDDIFARIKADKMQPGSPVKSFSMESVKGDLLGNELGNYWGIRYSFEIVCKFNQGVDTNRWDDGTEPDS